MATAAGESPTATNRFCSPAFDMTGIEQRVAIALTATRLRMTGGIDIMLPHRKSGARFARLRVFEFEGFGGGKFVTTTYQGYNYLYLFRFPFEKRRQLR
jgi:hypothetical protein